MTPKVDTFEHDIAEEIKRKDASMTEISAARKDIGNDGLAEEEIKKPAPVLLITLILVFIFGFIGLLAVLYFYFTDSLLPPSQESVPVTVTDIPKVNKSIGSVSATLDREIGRYITNVEKQEAGYILTISDYSPVFAYMVRNEEDYIEELVQAVGGHVVTTPAVTQAPIATTTNDKATSTQTGTSTISGNTSSTTPTTLAPYYYDVTIANQNMRVYKDGEVSVVYAFITTNKIAVSRTTEGILTLKSVIIR